MNASVFASSLTASALLTISILSGCTGERTSDVLASDLDAALDGPVTDVPVANDAAEDAAPDTASTDDGVPADVVNVAYLGIVGTTQPYAVLLQRNGHIPYRVTHLTTECTMVEGVYATNNSEFVQGSMRVSSGSRYYTLDFETGGRTDDLGDGGTFAQPGDAVDFVTMSHGTTVPFPAITAHLRRPPAIALLGTPVGSAHTIDRTQPMAIQWTPPTDSQGITLHVGLFTMSATGQNELWCDFPAASGTATVPADVLSRFPAGNGSISINSHSGEVDEIDGWHVRISYFNDATYPGATTYYYAMVTFE